MSWVAVLFFKYNFYTCGFGIGVAAAEFIIIIDSGISCLRTYVYIFDRCAPGAVFCGHRKGNFRPYKVCASVAVKCKHPSLTVTVAALHDLSVRDVYAAIGVAACARERKEGGVDSAFNIIAERLGFYGRIVRGIAVARILGVDKRYIISCLWIKGHRLQALISAVGTGDIKIVIGDTRSDRARGCTRDRAESNPLSIIERGGLQRAERGRCNEKDCQKNWK